MQLVTRFIVGSVAGTALAVGLVTACAPAGERAADTVATAASTPAAPAVPAAPAPTTPAGTPVIAAADLPTMTVYKTPTCGCCKEWVRRAQAAGYRVVVHDTGDVAPIKRQYGISDALHSCHTAVVGGYVVEGHVPIEDITRLVTERPRLAGIAVPGMPVGSPGMEMGTQKDPYDVIAFTKEGETSVYAKH